MKIYLLVLGLSFTFLAQAQTEKSKIQTLEDTLSVLSQIRLNAQEAEARFSACHRMIPMLTKALQEPNSFDYKFDKLKSISFQYPQDSSFRVITWQLYVDTSEYRYYGAIQMNTEDLQLHPLIDRSFNVQYTERQLLSNKNWYGAVYYNLKSFKTPEGMKHLLFGYDGFSYYKRRKVIDVLSFQNGKPIFGAPVFVNEERGRTKNRIVLEYAANSSVRCNYDEFKEAIIFDHLLRTTSEVGGGATSVPDGSFEGYKYVKRGGYWKHIDKMFNTIVNEAPREHPVLDSKRNLFGKSKD
ncbi:MAG: hypothetical protein AAF738_04250 [Bacteroidota bacterium]